MAKGSSPRMRGAVLAGGGASCSLGIIPAHAGSSRAKPLHYRERGIIPAHAGSRYCLSGNTRVAAGSSPRMRGAAVAHIAEIGISGIIPAHAGSRAAHTRWHRRNRDHPRACGEQGRDVDRCRSRAGSSPRMRGAARQDLSQGQASGIIPAHAGSRARKQIRMKSRWDHPRACGEQT